MTRLSILSTKEKIEFESPPVFSKGERERYFHIGPDIRRIVFRMQPTFHVGFILELGYFKAQRAVLPPLFPVPQT